MVNKNYILKPRKIEYTKEDKKIAKLKELKPYLKYYSQFKLSLIFLAIFLLTGCMILKMAKVKYY